MATPVHVPRINNNDDEVKLVEIKVTLGQQVQAGEVLGSVETDKAMVDVESPAAGFVIAVLGEVDTQVGVGSVLIWLGATADEQPPKEEKAAADAHGAAAPTAKALALLREYGLNADAVRASGERLSAEDVRRHVTAKGLRPKAAAASAAAAPSYPGPSEAGRAVALQSHERGMLATVSWQRDVAVPGYIELAYDHVAWEGYATALGAQHKLLLNPLLPLLAHRLVEQAVKLPRANATLVGDQRHEYEQVNLGFTVQSGEVLYLAVVRNAAAMDTMAFVHHLVDLQRRAAAHELNPDELQGATIGFSSMSRWKVERHVPILAPNTALMVAHTVAPDGSGILGATYDHRVLHGGDVAGLLKRLGQPPKN